MPTVRVQGRWHPPDLKPRLHRPRFWNRMLFRGPGTLTEVTEITEVTDQPADDHVRNRLAPLDSGRAVRRVDRARRVLRVAGQRAAARAGGHRAVRGGIRGRASRGSG